MNRQMNIERVGFMLASFMTRATDSNLSLEEHISIQEACRNIVAKADEKDIKEIFMADPEFACEVATDFDKLNAILKD